MGGGDGAFSIIKATSSCDHTATHRITIIFDSAITAAAANAFIFKRKQDSGWINDCEITSPLCSAAASSIIERTQAAAAGGS